MGNTIPLAISYMVFVTKTIQNLTNKWHAILAVLYYSSDINITYGIIVIIIFYKIKLPNVLK